MKTVWILCTPTGQMHEKTAYETAALAMKGLQELKYFSFPPDNLGIYECAVIEAEERAA